jgi:hypothetical protein
MDFFLPIFLVFSEFDLYYAYLFHLVLLFLSYFYVTSFAGAPVSQLPELLASKTVTISQLMKIVPPDTVDPTPFLFNSTMYTLSCLLGCALLCNMAIRPVHAKHFEALPAPSSASNLSSTAVSNGTIETVVRAANGEQAKKKSTNE